jgi:methyltransferase (TIGR00027 family)
MGETDRTKTNQAAQTAYGPMSIVAIEQYYPQAQRLVHDELASEFLPPGLRALLKVTRWSPLRALLFNLSDKGARGVWGGVLCRKRYIDDKLLEAARAGIQAVVILGAGLDTRAYRLAALGAIPVFEVDLPENVAYKRAKLQAVFGSVPAHVALVQLDFESQDLASALASQGYRGEYKSFFLWEGVTQYLSEDGVQRTLRFLAQAKAGSRLAFTYVRKDFIDGTARYGLDRLYETYRVKEQLWHFGLEPEQVATFLETYGWREVEQVGSQEYVERYLKPAGREMSIMEIERAVYAEKP